MRRPHLTYRAALGAAALAAVLGVSGCSDPVYVGNGAWQSQITEPGPQVQPLPDPQPEPGGTNPSDPSQSDPNAPADDPNVMATGLDQPWGIAPLPDGTALVGERATGKVFKVFPDGITPKQELLTIPGIDGTGDGGLLGIAASANFVQDGLVYAYITTPTDNQVISFTLAGAVVPLLTGIPKGTVHNGGALAVGPDGLLYIGTGDTGQKALATDVKSLAGKVLRIDEFGESPSGGGSNPADLVLARGLVNPTGVCLSAQAAYVVEGGGGQVGSPSGDALFSLAPGANYASVSPLVDYDARTEPTGAAGCVAVSTSAVVTMLDGQALWATILDKQGQPGPDPQKAIEKKYGRLRGVALDPASGSLWVSTSNRDAAGQPGADDDRVLLIPSPTGGGGGGIT